MPRAKPRIVLTLGDPAGIGPEVVARALSQPNIRRLASFLILGHDAVLRETCSRHRIRLQWTTCSAEQPEFQPGITLHEPCPLGGQVPSPGRWTARTGRISLSCVECAVDLCRQQIADAMVTGPICKAAWKKAGAEWPGHTELLAARTNSRRYVMMLSGRGLRVALVTIHERLRDVPRLVTGRRIAETVRVVHADLRARFGCHQPRIAVLGLNPHAGEEGRMGSEEKEVIAPAIRRLNRSGISVSGPLPADTAFHRALQGEFDVVVAMYHDQGLGPLKTVAFDTGVNITLGLPIVRTSVDHGTAFDIAGTGRASPASCAEAIRTAVNMAENRNGKG